MFELFTALFTILFALFALAAIAGHVLLAQAVLRMLRPRTAENRPSSQAAVAARPVLNGMSAAVTGQ